MKKSFVFVFVFVFLVCNTLSLGNSAEYSNSNNTISFMIISIYLFIFILIFLIFVPTHMSRNEKLAESGKEWLKQGGYVDFTADGANVGDHVADYLSMPPPSPSPSFPHLITTEQPGGLSRVTVSSDAYGSLPKFDEHGVLVGYDYGKPTSLLRVLKYVRKK
jgi:hypothetical protein